MESNNNYSKRIINIFRLTLIICFSSTILLFSQVKSDTEYDLPQIAIVNYLSGAQTDNAGLKASCIYFLGKYRVLEANSQLIDEIHNTKDENIRILIAWSIYRIGEESGINELEKIALNCESDNLKVFCSNLHGIKMLENALSNN